MTANIINHIVFVLDASQSMESVAQQLIKVADNQIQYLAQRSKDLDQETRITVYKFGTGLSYVTGFPRGYKPEIDCLVYDKDVLRMPSISGLYKTRGMTPLMDATWLALDDLAMTPEKYGEHSFLVYVLTDGQENASAIAPSRLAAKIAGLPEHWTVATFVPNPVAVHEAKRFGFPAQNIAVWDATTSAGVKEAGERIRQTTETFMTGRAAGIRGTKNLFSLEKPSIAAIDKNLTALNWGQFRIFEVVDVARIDEFIEAKTGRPYKRGEGYYQLSKRETIQPQKEIAILGKKGVYVGDDARSLLGLPGHEVKVAPTDNTDYEVFVQSTSNNRKLMPGTKLLVLS